MAAIERVRVSADPDVGLEPPVFQVVTRFEPVPREIGDLIPHNPERGKAIDCGLIELGREIFARNSARTVTGTATENLLAQSAVFIHLEDVTGDVRRRKPLDPVKRAAP